MENPLTNDGPDTCMTDAPLASVDGDVAEVSVEDWSALQKETEIHQDAILGPVEPLLRAILYFIYEASSENNNRSSPLALFSSAKITLGRFRLWTKSFDGEEFDMITIIDGCPHLKETIASLLSNFTTILVGEFGQRESYS